VQLPATPGWRLWLTLLSIVVIASTVSIYVSIREAERTTDETIARDRAARVVQHEATCTLVAHILAAYEETPPPTTAGRNVAEAWRDEYRTIGCPPR
jgi:hypothetical protein